MKPLSFLAAALLCRKVNQPQAGRSTDNSSHWGAWGGLLMSLAIAPIAGVLAPADAAELTQWSFDPATRQLEVRVVGGTTPNYFLLAQPARIVLDLPNTTVGSILEEQSYSGVVRSVRVGQFQPDLTRIVIELSPDAVLAPAQVELRSVGSTGGGRSEQWVVRPLLAGDAPVVAVEPVPPTPVPEGVDDPVEVESEGVVFEPAAEEADSSAPESSSEVAIANPNLADDDEPDEPEPDEPDEPDEPEVLLETSEAPEPETNMAWEISDLPPLEPGAFEIPVVIPPPSGERPRRPSLEPEAESGQDELAPSETQPSGDDSEEINLPVAIAPPESIEATTDVVESDAENSGSLENSNRSESPTAADPNLSNRTASDSVDSDSTNQTTQRIEVTTPEEFQQALNEIIASGRDTQIVRRQPAEPDEANIEPPQAEQEASEPAPEPIAEQPVEPDEVNGSTASEDTAIESVATDSSESTPLEEREAIAPPVTNISPPEVPNPEVLNPEAPSPEVLSNENLDSPTAAFPSPESAVSIAAVDSPESEILRDLPPATVDIEESVTVTVPSPNQPNATSPSAEPPLAEAPSTEPPLTEPASTEPALEDRDVTTAAVEPDSTEADDSQSANEVDDVQNVQAQDIQTQDIQTDDVQSVQAQDIQAQDVQAQDIQTTDIDEIEIEPAEDTSTPESTATSAPANSVAAALPDPADALPPRLENNPPAPTADAPAVVPVEVPIQRDRQLIVASRPDAQIPSGTVLTLRYPRLTSTLLQTGIAWQDVLLLEQTIRDRTGQVIAPEGSQIIGRFEITDRQVRFVTQAIALDGRNIPLQAVSGWVAIGDNADTVLIRPNQIVNVRLAENFSR
ncbi:MAG: AMIN domain-containing protein [Elainellaceae cyanobacterium]